MMHIKHLVTTITQQLQPLYDGREAAAIAYLYVQTKLELQRYELALRGQEQVEDVKMAEIERDVEKLAQGCPVQYVLGETEFYGLPFLPPPQELLSLSLSKTSVKRIRPPTTATTPNADNAKTCDDDRPLKNP